MGSLTAEPRGELITYGFNYAPLSPTGSERATPGCKPPIRSQVDLRRFVGGCTFSQGERETGALQEPCAGIAQRKLGRVHGLDLLINSICYRPERVSGSEHKPGSCIPKPPAMRFPVPPREKGGLLGGWRNKGRIQRPVYSAETSVLRPGALCAPLALRRCWSSHLGAGGRNSAPTLRQLLKGCSQELLEA